MQFHRYKTSFELADKQFRGSDPIGFCDRWLSQSSLSDLSRARIRCERAYLLSGRTYYEAWPFFARMIGNSKLNIRLSEIEECANPISIHFRHGKEPDFMGGRVLAVMAMLSQTMLDQDGHYQQMPNMLISLDRQNENGERDGSTYFWAADHSFDAYDFGEATPFARLAVGVMLLRSDQRFTETLLPTPQGKRAKRKGQLQPSQKGHSIGRDLEGMSGHFRSPHFGIRHVGRRGSSRPELRFIKGSIVREDRVLPVPTGQLGEVSETTDPTSPRPDLVDG